MVKQKAEPIRLTLESKSFQHDSWSTLALSNNEYTMYKSSRRSLVDKVSKQDRLKKKVKKHHKKIENHIKDSSNMELNNLNDNYSMHASVPIESMRPELRNEIHTFQNYQYPYKQASPDYWRSIPHKNLKQDVQWAVVAPSMQPPIMMQLVHPPKPYTYPPYYIVPQAYVYSSVNYYPYTYPAP